MKRTSSLPHRRIFGLLFGLVVLFALGGSVAAGANEDREASVAIPERGEASHFVVPPPLPGGEGGPCSLSHRLSGSDPFSHVTSVPHWMPHNAHASRRSLAAAWSCAGGVVVLEFGSGVQVGLEPGWGDVPAARAWAGLVEEQGHGRVEEIRGAPALLQEPGTGVRRGQVLVIDGDTLIRVLGNWQLAAEELAGIAGSVGPQG